MVKVPPWHCLSSPSVPPQGAPGGSGRLGTPRKRPTYRAPSHCLGCSSEPPPESRISPPLTIQASRGRRWRPRWPSASTSGSRQSGGMTPCRAGSRRRKRKTPRSSRSYPAAGRLLGGSWGGSRALAAEPHHSKSLRRPALPSATTFNIFCFKTKVTKIGRLSWESASHYGFSSMVKWPLAPLSSAPSSAPAACASTSSGSIQNKPTPPYCIELLLEEWGF